jgi:hypothetical protein
LQVGLRSIGWNGPGTAMDEEDGIVGSLGGHGDMVNQGSGIRDRESEVGGDRANHHVGAGRR